MNKESLNILLENGISYCSEINLVDKIEAGKDEFIYVISYNPKNSPLFKNNRVFHEYYIGITFEDCITPCLSILASCKWLTNNQGYEQINDFNRKFDNIKAVLDCENKEINFICSTPTTFLLDKDYGKWIDYAVNAIQYVLNEVIDKKMLSAFDLDIEGIIMGRVKPRG